MKKTILGLILICQSVIIFAQKESKEVETDTLSLDSIVLSAEEKLVQLAIAHNSDVKILATGQKAALYNARKAKWDWVNHVTVSGNLNEFTLDQSSNSGGDAQPAFFPRYNISLTLPLGVLATRSNDVKIAKQKLDASTLKIQREEQDLRRQVLTLYENYKLHQSLITIQNEKTEDELAYFKSVERQFGEQNADIKTFKDASNQYNVELEKGYKLNYELKVIKLALENLIGTSLEAVLIEEPSPGAQ